MKIEVHLLTHDDEQMLEWSLRHYFGFADVVVLHDGGPEGASSERASSLHARLGRMGSILRCQPWDTAGELNDDLARRLKNSCWQGSGADWVIVADADELVWSPLGLRRRLELARDSGAAVLRPNGFEMFSDVWFDARDYADLSTQITELVPFGSPDDKWYAKPIVFSPRRVADSGFGIGAHESRPVLRDGRAFTCGPDWPFAGGLALLHYKSIYGGVERIAARYDATRARLSAVNVRHGWGNFSPGTIHAKEKRDLLLPGVRRVVS